MGNCTSSSSFQAGSVILHLTMIAFVQRVSEAQVAIDNKVVSSIASGYLILLGVFESDAEKEADYLADKILNLRIMAHRRQVYGGQAEKMNYSILDVGG